MDENKTIKDAINYIESQLEQSVTVTDVSKETSYSVKQLNRIFSNMTGISITRYITKRKLAVGAELIAEGSCSINYVSDILNINPSNFSKLFKAEFGVLPKEVRGNFNDLNLFGPFDIESYIEIARQIKIGLESLKVRNVLNYKMKNSGQTIVIKDLNYEWIFEFLMTKPSIPLPINMMMNLNKIAEDESDFKELLISVLTSTYFEWLKIDGDLTMMKWNYILENQLSDKDQEELEIYYNDIENLYDLKKCECDEKNGLVWFNVKKEFLRNIFEMIECNCDGDYLSVILKKEEFVLLGEIGEKIGLLYFSQENEGQIYLNFNASKFLSLIGDIGRKIVFPAFLMNQIDEKGDKALFLALNKEMYESVNTGNDTVSLPLDEFIIRFLIISAYYDLDTPVTIVDQYTYCFSYEMEQILEASHRAECEGVVIPVAYEIKQTEKSVKLILKDSYKKWLRFTNQE